MSDEEISFSMLVEALINRSTEILLKRLLGFVLYLDDIVSSFICAKDFNPLRSFIESTKEEPKFQFSGNDKEKSEISEEPISKEHVIEGNMLKDDKESLDLENKTHDIHDKEAIKIQPKYFIKERSSNFSFNHDSYSVDTKKISGMNEGQSTVSSLIYAKDLNPLQSFIESSKEEPKFQFSGNDKEKSEISEEPMSKEHVIEGNMLKDGKESLDLEHKTNHIGDKEVIIIQPESFIRQRCSNSNFNHDLYPIDTKKMIGMNAGQNINDWDGHRFAWNECIVNMNKSKVKAHFSDNYQNSVLDPRNPHVGCCHAHRMCPCTPKENETKRIIICKKFGFSLNRNLSLGPHQQCNQLEDICRRFRSNDHERPYKLCQR